jgi:hypothetical protein
MSAFEHWLSQAVGCLLHSTGYSSYDECTNISKIPTWSGVLERLTCSQPLKKFPAFYGTRRFITAFTSVRHLSVTWARAIHSTSWRSILMLSSHLRLGFPSCLFPTVLTTKTLYTPLLSPHVLHASPFSFFSI